MKTLTLTLIAQQQAIEPAYDDTVDAADAQQQAIEPAYDDTVDAADVGPVYAAR
jgi:hypothetical protein